MLWPINTTLLYFRWHTFRHANVKVSNDQKIKPMDQTKTVDVKSISIKYNEKELHDTKGPKTYRMSKFILKIKCVSVFRLAKMKAFLVQKSHEELKHTTPDHAIFRNFVQRLLTMGYTSFKNQNRPNREVFRI